MNIETYPLFQSSDGLFYTFNSWGSKGSIRKIVQFSPMAHNYFILAFGDYNSTLNQMDDRANSNNGDLRKVMGTILTCIDRFFEERPESTLYFQGSNPRRTRFYQWIIQRNALRLNKKYYILGKTIDGDLETIRNLRKYEGFEVQKRSDNFVGVVGEPAALYLINALLMRELVKRDHDLEELSEQQLQEWLDANSTRIMFPEKYRLCLESLGMDDDPDSPSG